ncbi:MAG: helix-turn-helix transcriptional regulator [Bryobacteraceae bacterium]
MPAGIRRELIAARRHRGWSQAELGRRAGLPQMHISKIETGKIAPRFDTLLDLVRVLDRDLLMVPRGLVPAVQALIRGEPDLPLYATPEEDDEEAGGDEA